MVRTLREQGASAAEVRRATGVSPGTIARLESAPPTGEESRLSSEMHAEHADLMRGVYEKLKVQVQRAELYQDISVPVAVDLLEQVSRARERSVEMAARARRLYEQSPAAPRSVDEVREEALQRLLEAGWSREDSERILHTLVPDAEVQAVIDQEMLDEMLEPVWDDAEVPSPENPDQEVAEVNGEVPDVD